MAGIGFELRRLFAQETFTAWVKAYAFGAVIALGPFFCSVACLAGLALLSVGVTDLATRQIFAGAIVYVFGGSLVTTGLIQVIVTRYLADKVYRGEYDALIQAFFPVLLVTSSLLFVLGAPWLFALPISWLARFTLLSLYETIGCLWLTVVFVTSAHGHRSVVVSFLVGSVVAFGLGLALLGVYGLEGLLIGYATGHFLILALLIGRLFRDHGLPRRWSWGILQYVRLFPSLIAIGMLQHLGIWIDKVVFWTSDLAVSIGGIVTAPRYDSATFLAFLTAQPAVVHFLVRQEVEFEDKLHGYLDEVFFRSSLDAIQRAADQVRTAVLGAFTDILKVQGVATFLCVVYAEGILRTFGLPLSQIGIFRAGVIGSLFLVFMLFANVILLYLDRRLEVLSSAILFVATNLGLSLLSLRLGYPTYGFGFAAACLLALVCSLYHLFRQLRHLELMTFATIPIMGQQRARAGLRAFPGGQYGRYHPLRRAR